MDMDEDTTNVSFYLHSSDSYYDSLLNQAIQNVPAIISKIAVNHYTLKGPTNEVYILLNGSEHPFAYVSTINAIRYCQSLVHKLDTNSGEWNIPETNLPENDPIYSSIAYKECERYDNPICRRKLKSVRIMHESTYETEDSNILSIDTNANLFSTDLNPIELEHAWSAIITSIGENEQQAQPPRRKRAYSSSSDDSTVGRRIPVKKKISQKRHEYRFTIDTTNPEKEDRYYYYDPDTIEIVYKLLPKKEDGLILWGSILKLSKDPNNSNKPFDLLLPWFSSNIIQYLTKILNFFLENGEPEERAAKLFFFAPLYYLSVKEPTSYTLDTWEDCQAWLFHDSINLYIIPENRHNPTELYRAIYPIVCLLSFDKTITKYKATQESTKLVYNYETFCRLLQRKHNHSVQKAESSIVKILDSLFALKYIEKSEYELTKSVVSGICHSKEMAGLPMNMLNQTITDTILSALFNYTHYDSGEGKIRINNEFVHMGGNGASYTIITNGDEAKDRDIIYAECQLNKKKVSAPFMNHVNFLKSFQNLNKDQYYNLFLQYSQKMNFFIDLVEFHPIDKPECNIMKWICIPFGRMVYTSPEYDQFIESNSNDHAYKLISELLQSSVVDSTLSLLFTFLSYCCLMYIALKKLNIDRLIIQVSPLKWEYIYYHPATTKFYSTHNNEKLLQFLNDNKDTIHPYLKSLVQKDSILLSQILGVVALSNSQPTFSKFTECLKLIDSKQTALLNSLFLEEHWLVFILNYLNNNTTTALARYKINKGEDLNKIDLSNYLVENNIFTKYGENICGVSLNYKKLTQQTINKAKVFLSNRGQIEDKFILFLPSDLNFTKPISNGLNWSDLCDLMTFHQDQWTVEKMKEFCQNVNNIEVKRVFLRYIFANNYDVLVSKTGDGKADVLTYSDVLNYLKLPKASQQQPKLFPLYLNNSEQYAYLTLQSNLTYRYLLQGDAADDVGNKLFSETSTTKAMDQSNLQKLKKALSFKSGSEVDIYYPWWVNGANLKLLTSVLILVDNNIVGYLLKEYDEDCVKLACLWKICHMFAQANALSKSICTVNNNRETVFIFNSHTISYLRKQFNPTHFPLSTSFNEAILQILNIQESQHLFICTHNAWVYLTIIALILQLQKDTRDIRGPNDSVADHTSNLTILSEHTPINFKFVIAASAY